MSLVVNVIIFSIKFSKEEICRLLKIRKSRRIAESRPVCVGLNRHGRYNSLKPGFHVSPREREALSVIFEGENYFRYSKDLLMHR